MTVLTFCRWYCKTAVYLGDSFLVYEKDLVLQGVGRLFGALGYSVERLDDVPTHDFTEFHEADRLGWWVPPPSLAVLKEQIRRRKLKEARHTVEVAERHLGHAKDDLARLEGRR